MFVVCVLCCDVVLCTYRLQAGEFKLSPELVALVLSWLERVGAFDEDWIRRFVGLLLRRLVALLACWLCTLWLNSVSRISFLLPLLLTPSQIVSGCLDLDGSQWLVVLAREALGLGGRVLIVVPRPVGCRLSLFC